jgi:N-sulfoglucosamine sulfohydrolase
MKNFSPVRFSTLSMLVLLMACLCGGTVSASERSAVSKPNIIFAIADDWSYGHAGAYGCKWVKTPAMDRVARDGILFTNAYTPCGKCSPSRACILTGRNPWQLKAAANHAPFLPQEFKSFPEALGEHGYFTGMTGKGWGPGVAVDAAGRKRELTGPEYEKLSMKPPCKTMSGNDYSGNFKQFLDAAPKDRPWCFWYGGHEPHRPYLYGSGVKYGGKKTSDIDRVPSCWPDTEEVRNDMLDYAFKVEYFDHHLGLMLAELEKRGLLENTLVVVTSDNGMPFPHNKGYAYQNSDHLPLAIMWKQGIAVPGRRVEDYVSFIDFAPTFLELAGLNGIQAGMAPITGQSLTGIFTSNQSGQVIAGRDHVLIGKERNDTGRPKDQGYPIRGIVKAGMLYLRNFETSRWPGGDPETGYKDTDDSPTKTAVLKTQHDQEQQHFWQLCFGKLPQDQLFDVIKDPDCTTNLATTTSFTALQSQLFGELKQQEDPRMSGDGHLFDEYQSSSRGARGIYEKTMSRKQSNLNQAADPAVRPKP